jgi:hypothetical protein
MDRTIRILACVFAFALQCGLAVSQELELDAEAAVSGGAPLMVTVHVSPLSEISGKLAIGQSTIYSQYLFDENKRLLEWVYFEDGRPVEFDRCTYEGERLASKVRKTEKTDVTSLFTWNKTTSMETTRKDDSSLLGWTRREELQDQDARTVRWAMSFDADDQLLGASRTTVDSKGRAVEKVSYGSDRKMQSLRHLEYLDNQTVEKTYGRDSALLSVSTVKKDENGQVVERVTDSSRSGKTITRTALTYDGEKNWIESTAFRKSADSGRLEPLFRVSRDIVLRSETSKGPASIEPKVLFPRKGKAEQGPKA